MKYVLAVLVVLVVADGVITNVLVGGGLAREGNPFIRGLVGGNYFLAIKAAGALVCAFILWDIHKHWPRLALGSTICFTIVYAMVVLWNSFLYLVQA